MNSAWLARKPWVLPVALGIVGGAVFLLWLAHHPPQALALRVPGTDAAPAAGGSGAGNPVLTGTLQPGPGQPARSTGAWPQFRGPARTGIAAPEVKLARQWPAAGPRELWRISVGDGYAGPVIADGRVYLMDYDVEQRRDALRCLSLADGREIWRYSYPVAVKRNHGMSRSVPAVAGGRVVAIGPKGHVLCNDAVTGELRWTIDLVKEHGAVIPEWYAAQCPLIDGDQVVLAPAGPDALLLAVDFATGAVRWRSPNSHGWKMTHSSVATVEFAGRRQYVYCASKGVAGVAADDGTLLWETPDWKISIATVPSPCPLEDGRIFLTGGYNAGSLLLQLRETNGWVRAETAFKLGSQIFGSTQHTPLWLDGHLYGTRADGKFVCLDAAGKILWTSGAGDHLGLGPYLAADGLILALNDSGQLRLLEATPRACRELARADVLPGARESWGPMALADGRLLLRDLTRLVCLEVGASPQP